MGLRAKKSSFLEFPKYLCVKFVYPRQGKWRRHEKSFVENLYKYAIETQNIRQKDGSWFQSNPQGTSQMYVFYACCFRMDVSLNTETSLFFDWMTDWINVNIMRMR